MLSLIRKDLGAVGWFLLAVIPLGAIQLAVTASVGPVFLPAAFFFSALLAFGSILVEEFQRTEVLWNSLPVTRCQIVMARYGSCLLGMLIGLSLSWAVGQATTRWMPTGGGRPALFVSLEAHIVLFATLVLASAVFLPFYFRYGAGLGGILFSAVAAGVLVLCSLLVQVVLVTKGHSGPMIDPETWKGAGSALQAELAAWLEDWRGRIMALLVALSAGAMLLSSLISWRLYETRDL